MENSPQNSNLELDARINNIIAKEEGYDEPELSQEDRERYLKKYSFGALVFSAIYFGYMKDKIFLWLSIVLGIIFFPVLFILPFFARKRAWRMRQWRSFNHFRAVQKKWEKAAVYGAVIFVAVFFISLYFETKILNGFLNSSNINNMNDVKQLQEELQGSIEN